jgi:hypothetical protein
MLTLLALLMLALLALLALSLLTLSAGPTCWPCPWSYLMALLSMMNLVALMNFSGPGLYIKDGSWLLLYVDDQLIIGFALPILLQVCLEALNFLSGYNRACVALLNKEPHVHVQAH